MKVFNSDEMVAVISKDDARELDLLIDCLRRDTFWSDDEQSEYILVCERDKSRWSEVIERIKNQLK